ncbi:hypothetical protein RCL_jg1082.t1 [Rhizophagus clarus]|uniref:Uncharacterized protein n=1 Tax=Rhizophagus clarus TaxID=94130 RepID=A0A8H3MCX8_9GLOM|nr:hypothetical protein RCL_jg1082.t1 [Rhizophagus clarus]
MEKTEKKSFAEIFKELADKQIEKSYTKATGNQSQNSGRLHHPMFRSKANPEVQKDSFAGANEVTTPPGKWGGSKQL